MINVAMEWFNKIKKMFKCEDDYSEQKEVPVRQLPILHAPVEDSCDEISLRYFDVYEVALHGFHLPYIFLTIVVAGICVAAALKQWSAFWT